MQPDLARQRQQLQRPLEIDRRRIDALRHATNASASRPLRLRRAARRARIGPVRSVTARPVSGSKPSDLPSAVDFTVARAGPELPRVAALGIVAAADEGAVLAGDLERSGGRSRTLGHARGSRAIVLGREDVRPEHLVQRFQHLADAQILDLVDRAGELPPEVAQTSFHSSLPSEMRSSFSSRSAVKSYST